MAAHAGRPTQRAAHRRSTTSPRSTGWATSRCTRCAASTLDVDAGEFVAVMGPSGSGKSTLMNILGCLDRPTSGRYRLDGRGRLAAGRATSSREIRNRTLGFVFQSFNLLSRTTALENVELPLRLRRRAARASAARARREALERVGPRRARCTTTRTSSRAASSSASRSRARSSTSPRLILADEPTGNLDSRDQRRGDGAASRSCGATGITIVLVTHEPDIAALRRARDRRARRPASSDATGAGDARRAARGRARAERARMRPAATIAPASRSRALLRNKLRSFLTALGIIIGVARGDRDGGDRRGRARRRVEQAFAAMGTNLLIVIVGRRRRRAARTAASARMPTLTWDDLRGDPARGRRRCAYAAPQLRTTAQVDRRGAELDDQRHRHDARATSTIRNWPVAHGRAASRRRTSTAAPRSSCSARPSPTSCSAPAPIRSARPCASRTSRSRWSACWRARASRRCGQDYDDAVFVPVDDVPGEDPGRPAEVHPGHDHGRAPTSDDDDRARAAADHARCCATATSIARGRRRRLLDPQPDRDRQRAAGGHADADARCSPASPRCRCWSAASAS